MTYSIRIPPLQGFLPSSHHQQTKLPIQSSLRQSGVANVLVLAFATVLSVGLASIYYTTQQAVAKRELVNAADAGAYSGATIIAQGLNYTASTNRAILANNALIGQMVSITSTLKMSTWYWRNTAKMWRAFGSMVKLFPFIGTYISAGAQGFSYFSKYWGKGLEGPLMLANVLTQASTAAVGVTNLALFASQQVHLADSLVMYEPHMVKIAKSNASGAEVDQSLEGTFFGPLMTVGTLAATIEMKLRSRERTIDGDDGDNTKSNKDKYLNYVTEKNRNVHTSAYVGGRSLMPNAVTLWIAPPGCRLGDEFLQSSEFSPPAGTNYELDAAIRSVKGMTAALGMLGETFFCMHSRKGGAELVQLKSGKMAWLAVDAISVTPPILPPNLIADASGYKELKLGNLPMAGAAMMSFSDVGYDQRESYNNFQKHIRKVNNGEKYLGHQVALPADCVEFIAPGEDPEMRAVSDNGRTSGRCAVLATGFESQASEGMFHRRLERTTQRIFDVGPAPPITLGAAIIEEFIAPFKQAVTDNVANLGAQASDAVTPDVSSVTNAVPPGTSSCTNCSAAAMTNVKDATAAGKALLSQAWVTGKDFYKQKARALGGALLPNKFKLDLHAFQDGDDGSSDAFEGRDGDRIPKIVRIFLRDILRMGELLDMIQMETTDGIEMPGATVNPMLYALADGLPPWFWDVRTFDLNQGRAALKDTDLVVNDQDRNDYHERRYNLGPVVFLPLFLTPPKLKFAARTSASGTDIPSWESNDDRKLRAMGKARIFFRQPSDQWMNRYKVVVTKSLLLPYWQVRNEGLSYIEKWTLLAIQGITADTDQIKDN